jgi:low temperature requirement protein LtrA
MRVAVATSEPVSSAADERHASWAELFFDLVAVAGVAMLAHILSLRLDFAALGLYAVLFLSFWLTWVTFMLYGNVAAGSTHLVRLLVGMFGLGVMAASIPEVAHSVLEQGDSRAVQVYTVAYVVTRWIGSQSWQRGEVLLDFPVAQHLAGTLPWLVSLWVSDAARPWWWAAGVLLDLVLMFGVSGSELLARYQGRFEQRRDTRRRRLPRRPDDEGPVITGPSVDPAHLSERLGLFVIIVLGESVVQVVQAASGTPPDRHLLAAGAAAFTLLAGCSRFRCSTARRVSRTSGRAGSNRGSCWDCTAWSPATSPPSRWHSRWRSSMGPNPWTFVPAGWCAGRWRRTSSSAWSPPSPSEGSGSPVWSSGWSPGWRCRWGSGSLRG